MPFRVRLVCSLWLVMVAVAAPQAGDAERPSRETAGAQDQTAFVRLRVGNLVWNDRNDNGRVDPGEPGIPGVTVRIYDGDGIAVPASQGGVIATDAAGHYQYERADFITDVYTRRFTVEVETPAGCVSSTDVPTSFDPNDNVDNDDNGVLLRATTVRANPVDISQGGEPVDDGDNADGNFTVDFGFVCPTPPPSLSVGNLVWSDANANGRVDAGEPGIGGVTVRLLLPNRSTVVAATTTDLTGHYLFAGLRPGAYVLEAVAPDGFVSSTDILSTPDPDTDVDNDDNGIGVSGGAVQTGFVRLTPGGEPTDDGDSDADSNLTIDFGFFQTPAPKVSLGNLVWNDIDHDGLHDTGEPGLAGVAVRLLAANGVTLLATETTDANGQYLFTGLDAGRYAVEITLPAGFTSSPDTATSSDPDTDVDDDDNGVLVGAGTVRSALVTLAPGTEPVSEDPDPHTNLTLDFGVFQPLLPPPTVSVGDFVWRDTNGDGDVDAGEPGLSGVTLHLYAADGATLVGTATTDSGGRYRFVGLAPGDYVIEVVTPAGMRATTALPTSDDPDSDVDGDSNGVVLGEVTVRAQPVTLSAGSEPTTDGDADASSNLTVDFGFVRPPASSPLVSVGNFVWNDVNNNGVVDTGEAGIAGVTVRLRRATDETLVATTITGTGGEYLFSALEPDTYIVEVVVPSGGFISSTDVASTSDPNNDLNNDDNGVVADAGIVRSGPVVLAPDTEPVTDGDADPSSNLTVDFGFFQAGLTPIHLSLGNLVWLDANNNARVDAGEPGLSGVTVTLYSADGVTRLRETVTDANGRYQFGDLDEGTFIVEAARPAGMSSSGDIATSFDPNNDIDGDDNGVVVGPTAVRSLPVTIRVGTEPTGDGDADPNTNLTVDFGFYRPVQASPALGLGNLVWNDFDGNGRVDPGEPGVPGVTVRLYRADGSTLVASTLTDVSGLYGFPNLAPGGYIVEVLLPPGYVSTIDTAASSSPNSDVDGDDNGVGGAGATVRSTVVALTVGGEPVTDGDGDPNTNLTVDFGLTRPRLEPTLALGNLVWIDLDNDGRVDAGEPGRSGVMIDLYADADANGVPDGPVLATTSTDPQGRYAFTGLPSSTYLVRVRATNFAGGGALAGFATSTGNGTPAPSPNDDVDYDDNGTALADASVSSGPVTLAAGAEPTNDGDADPNTNLTVDFGFYAAAPDVRIHLSTQGSHSAVGAVVDYFIEVTNDGSIATAGPMTILFTLPSTLVVNMSPFGTGWACTVDGRSVVCTTDRPLPPGSTTNVTVWTQTVVATQVVTATATVDLKGDPVVANNTGSTNVLTQPNVGALVPGADLTIAQTGPTAVTTGANATYHLVVANSGPSAASNVVVNDLLPAGVVLDMVTTSVGACPRPRGALITCTLGTLGPGASATIDVSTFATESGLVLHAAYVRSSDTFDPALASNATVLATVVATGATLVTLPPPDLDGDGMPDEWELAMGLNPAVADAAADPDGDGRTNLQEFSAGTHPRGFYARYFAEGVTSAFFSTEFAIFTPEPGPDAHVLFRFLEADGSGTFVSRVIPALRRATVTGRDAFASAAAEFGTIVESDRPIVIDRTTAWGDGAYGSHAESGHSVPGTSWHLAEGATMGGFQLFYTLMNPTATPASVLVTFMREAPDAPIEREYVLPANTRTTVWVNAIPGLEAAAMSASVESRNGVPILVERSMYRDARGQVWGAGHGGAAAPAPASTWSFGEGATGDYFDMFLLMSNPGSTPASVLATYRRTDGLVVTRTYTVNPHARVTVWVDREAPELEDAALSTTLTVTDGDPIVAERVMWWPGGAATWHEAHVSLGSTETGTRWGVAAGEVGGPHATETYLLVGNGTADAADVRVRLVFEDGTTAAQDFEVAPNSRFTVDARAAFPQAADRRFAALVESVGPSPVPIVVECASYGSANGVLWASGTANLATRLP